MQNRRRMLKLAILAHGCRLAVTLRGGSIDSESRHSARRQQFAEFLADLHQLRKILNILPRARILYHGHSRRTPCRRRDLAIHLAPSLFHKRCNLANLSVHVFPLCNPVPSVVSALPKSVQPLNLRSFQSPNPRMYARARRHHQSQQNFVGARCVVDTHFHRVEVTPHIRRVDMRDRNIEPRSRPPNFFRRRYNRFRSAEHLAHRISAGHMPQCAVLQLSRRAHNRALAVAFNNFRVTAESNDECPSHLKTERLEIVHESFDVRNVLPGKRISNDSQCRRPPQRSRGHRPALVKNFFHACDALSNHDLRHAPSPFHRTASQLCATLRRRQPHASPAASSARPSESVPCGVAIPQSACPPPGLDQLLARSTLRLRELRGGPQDRCRERVHTQELEQSQDVRAGPPHWR